MKFTIAVVATVALLAVYTNAAPEPQRPSIAPGSQYDIEHRHRARVSSPSRQRRDIISDIPVVGGVLVGLGLGGLTGGAGAGVQTPGASAGVQGLLGRK